MNKTYAETNGHSVSTTICKMTNKNNNERNVSKIQSTQNSTQNTEK